MIPPAMFLLIMIVLATWSLLCFQLHVVIVFSTSMKKCIGILMGVSVDLLGNFCRMSITTSVIALCHLLLSPIFCSNTFFLQCFKVYLMSVLISFIIIVVLIWLLRQLWIRWLHHFLFQSVWIWYLGNILIFDMLIL